MARAADWTFTKRFRRGGFGRRASRLPSERIAEALAALHWICEGRGYELTALLKPTTHEVRWFREMLNLPPSSEAGRS